MPPPAGAARTIPHRVPRRRLRFWIRSIRECSAFSESIQNLNSSRCLFFWSTDNRPTDGDKAIGEIGTSHVAGGKEMYILGKEDVDIDEYDEGVMLHEWGHYFEHFAGRADSIGGSHGGGDNL